MPHQSADPANNRSNTTNPKSPTPGLSTSNIRSEVWWCMVAQFSPIIADSHRGARLNRRTICESASRPDQVPSIN